MNIASACGIENFNFWNGYHQPI